MNDRHKFRVWHKKLKQFVNGEGIFAIDDIGILMESELYEGYMPVDQNDYVIDNCVGIKDKNNKLMYKNDIVKVIYSEYKYSLHIIKDFEPDYPAFDLHPPIADDCNSISAAIANYEIEVVGNIYQNPEIMEEK